MTFKEELMELLKEELKVCKNLLDITLKKTDLLVGGEVESLKKITEREEDLINRMGTLEENRQKLLDQWGIKKTIPLSKIIYKIPEETHDLEEVVLELTKVLEEIGIRNQLNSQLLKDSLEWIDFNVNLLTNTKVPTTYKKDDERKILNNSLFDRKV